MAISENSMKVFELLKQYVDKQELTIPIIESKTGIPARSVQGILLRFSNLKLIERVSSVDVDGQITKYIVPNESILTYDIEASIENVKRGPAYSEATISIIKLLKTKVGTDEKFTAADVAAALGLPKASVETSITALSRKGYVKRGEPHGVIVNGKAVNLKYLIVDPSIKDAEF